MEKIPEQPDPEEYLWACPNCGRRLERRPKPSAAWLGAIARANRLD